MIAVMIVALFLLWPIPVSGAANPAYRRTPTVVHEFRNHHDRFDFTPGGLGGLRQVKKATGASYVGLGPYFDPNLRPKEQRPLGRIHYASWSWGDIDKTRGRPKFVIGSCRHWVRIFFPDKAASAQPTASDLVITGDAGPMYPAFERRRQFVLTMYGSVIFFDYFGNERGCQRLIARWKRRLSARRCNRGRLYDPASMYFDGGSTFYRDAPLYVVAYAAA